MSDFALFRPGVVAGQYPQREDRRLSALDRALTVAVGLVRQTYLRWSGVNRTFVRRVRKSEAALAGLSDVQLNRERETLAHALRTGGLAIGEIARVFALVGELAYRHLGMRHFDIQMIGGLVMMRGRIAEMDTGEGKTLTATLPAATAALAGVPVHVVTVNDYLASRDAAWMEPIYRALGLSVGVILEGMSTAERRKAYACDITYCTNKQIAFDYLKDRLILDQETRPLHLRIEGLYRTQPRISRVMMRGLCFAIVDEVDSVLVDEARTPLIISRAGDLSGLEETYARAIKVAGQLQTPRDFTVRERDWRVDLTDLGKAQIRRLTQQWGGVWAAETHRHELSRQALSALHLYQRDKHYLVRDGHVQIVDEYTGRIMADRSWERGLHQMIEVKEGCEITGRQETLARISYQRFFRRYMMLAGMTGTAREVAGELWSVYRLNVKRVPTNRPSRRRSLGEIYYATTDQKFRAIVERVAELNRVGRPVLIGTRSVAASEHLSGLLTRAGLPHRVLNARQDKFEAEIVAEAGQHAQITLATNMAGRGTDILLGGGVAELGGLFVLATERHDAGRIDRQFYGRCGRQGDPGEHLTMVSLEDDLMRVFYGRRLDGPIRLFDRGSGRVPALIGRPLAWLAQFSAESRHSVVRRSLLRADESLEDLLAFSGRSE